MVLQLFIGFLRILQVLKYITLTIFVLIRFKENAFCQKQIYVRGTVYVY